jgi:hypothetical protein
LYSRLVLLETVKNVVGSGHARIMKFVAMHQVFLSLP